MGEQRAGLLVEEMLGQQEIVIKTMGEKLKIFRGLQELLKLGNKNRFLCLMPNRLSKKQLKESYGLAKDVR